MNRLITFLLVPASLLSAFTACNKKNEKTAIFNTVNIEDARYLDPARAADAFSQRVSGAIYEPLYQYHYLEDGFRLIPLVAADIPSVSKDRLVVTIRLQQGIRFQDDNSFKKNNGRGREVRASDFVYSIKRLVVPSLKSPAWPLLQGKITGIDEFRASLAKIPRDKLGEALDKPVSGISALDDYTLQFKLVKPWPQLAHFLSTTYTAAIPREIAEDHSDETYTILVHHAGSGPFRLRKWERLNSISLERNHGYHPDFYPMTASKRFSSTGYLGDFGKSLPLLDGIEIKIAGDKDYWNDFLEGTYDAAPVPASAFRQTVSQNGLLNPALSTKAIRINTETGNRCFYIIFNMKNGLVGKDRNLRQAVAASIDPVKLMEVMNGGMSRPLGPALPSGFREMEPAAIKWPKFNPARAKQLFAGSGFSKSSAAIELEMPGTDTLNKKAGTLLIGMFEAAGMKLKINYIIPPEFPGKLADGKFQLAFFGWAADYPDAENILRLLYGPARINGLNPGSFENFFFDSLFAKIESPAGTAGIQKVISEIEALIAEEAPWIPVYQNIEYHAYHKWVTNYRASPFISNAFKYYRLMPDVKNRKLSEED